MRAGGRGIYGLGHGPEKIRSELLAQGVVVGLNRIKRLRRLLVAAVVFVLLVAAVVFVLLVIDLPLTQRYSPSLEKQGDLNLLLSETAV